MDEAKISQLIQEVHSREILWNRQHCNFKKTNLKSKEWQLVADNLGIEKDTCYNKWKTIHRRFSTELRKVNNCSSGDGDDDQYECQWEHFQSLQFLAGSVAPNTSTSNIDFLIEEDIDFKRFPQTSMASANKKFKGSQASSSLVTAHRSEEDYDEKVMHYLQNLSYHIKKIPASQQLVFQNQVNQVVFKFAYPGEDWASGCNNFFSRSPNFEMGPSTASSVPLQRPSKLKRLASCVDDDNDCEIVDFYVPPSGKIGPIMVKPEGESDNYDFTSNNTTRVPNEQKPRDFNRNPFSLKHEGKN